MDRRGRGGSGDSPTHELAREAEDVVAVIDGIGQPAYLPGHSYRALCSAEAALQTNGVAKLVLYEGIPLRGADFYPPGVLDRLKHMIEAGNTESALVTMLRDVAGMSAEDAGVLRSQTAVRERRLNSTSRCIPIPSCSCMKWSAF